MDLSPARFNRAADAAAPPGLALSVETAVLLAGVGARAAASLTARAQASLAPQAADPLFAPADGAFNTLVARDLAARRDRHNGE